MLKYILLVLSGSVAIAAIPQSTLSNPLNDRDMLCYMETSSGQVLNLSQLCGDATRPPAATEAAPTTAPVPSNSPFLESSTIRNVLLDALLMLILDAGDLPSAM